MRRLLFSLLAISLIGTLVGCRTSHGICDCGHDFDDPCAYRAPWVSEAAPKGEAPAPDRKEVVPTPPKKL
jgi:hypothetical protein